MFTKIQYEYRCITIQPQSTKQTILKKAMHHAIYTCVIKNSPAPIDSVVVIKRGSNLTK